MTSRTVIVTARRTPVRPFRKIAPGSASILIAGGQETTTRASNIVARVAPLSLGGDMGIAQAVQRD